MRTAKIWMIVVLFATLSLAGCTPTTGQNSATFSVGTTISHSTEQQFISITSQEQWYITIEYITPAQAEEWCSLSKSSGTGNGNVLVSFGTNTLEEDRVVTIHIHFPNEIISLTLTQRSPYHQPSVSDLTGWLELPSFTSDGEHYYFSKHMLPSSNKKERSFSILYDADNFIPLWVAYPLCNGNMYGSGNRTDDWGIMDPNIPEDKQLFMKYSYQGYYDRGHMLPSASRLGSNDDNRQTFYPTNMTPQISGLNQQKWAKLEGQVRDWANGCDTLYVVTGAVLQTTDGNEAVSYTYCRSDSSKSVAIPNYYYKALLQYRNNNGVRSYTAIAFWFPHVAASGAVTLQDAITIDRLEELTGIDFFTNLDEETQKSIESTIDNTRWKF